MIHLHMPFNLRQLFGIFFIADRFRQIDNRKHTVNCSHSPLQIAIYSGQALNRVGQVYRIGQEGHECTGRHLAVYDFIAAKAHDKGNGNRRQKFHRRRQKTGQLYIFHGSLEVQDVLVNKTLDFVFFPNKGFDHPNGGNTFLQKGCDLRSPLLNYCTIAFQLAAKNLHGLPDQRNNNQSQQGQFPIQVNHHDNRTNENGTFSHHLNQLIHQRRLNSRHIIGDIAHGFPSLMFVKIRHGHTLELAEHHFPHVNDHFLPDVGHQIGLSIVKYSANQEDHHNADADNVQHHHIFVRQNLIHHVLDNPGQIKVTSRCHHNADNGQPQAFQIRPDILQKALIILHVFPSLIYFAANSRAALSIRSATLPEAPGAPSF